MAGENSSGDLGSGGPVPPALSSAQAGPQEAVVAAAENQAARSGYCPVQHTEAALATGSSQVGPNKQPASKGTSHASGPAKPSRTLQNLKQRVGGERKGKAEAEAAGKVGASAPQVLMTAEQLAFLASSAATSAATAVFSGSTLAQPCQVLNWTGGYGHASHSAHTSVAAARQPVPLLALIPAATREDLPRPAPYAAPAPPFLSNTLQHSVNHALSDLTNMRAQYALRCAEAEQAGSQLHSEVTR
jgi:hypothetical protein